MTEHTFVIMLQIKTDDPRLSPEAVNEMLDSGKAGDFAKMRRVLLHRLPRDVERVIALFPVEHSKLLMMLHEAHGEDIARRLREEGIKSDAAGRFVRPPADYVPPTRG